MGPTPYTLLTIAQNNTETNPHTQPPLSLSLSLSLVSSLLYSKHQNSASNPNHIIEFDHHQSQSLRSSINGALIRLGVEMDIDMDMQRPQMRRFTMAGVVSRSCSVRMGKIDEGLVILG